MNQDNKDTKLGKRDDSEIPSMTFEEADELQLIMQRLDGDNGIHLKKKQVPLIQ